MDVKDKNKATQILAQMAGQGQALRIDVTEDIAFAEETRPHWVDVGKVIFHPEQAWKHDERYYDCEQAVACGGFEWSLPSAQELTDRVGKALPDDGFSDENRNRIQKSFGEGLQDVLRRLGLLYPVFDADTVSRLPFATPTTVVPDTSSVHQGGLDFVCRFLHPSARIKVPAIVHMEILNNADNYFKLRFANKKLTAGNRCRALQQHLLSQGGQRALLRTELNPDLELDRGDLGADPLRGIVTPSSDSEDKNLGLQQVVRSFADRLIVETARRFQAEVRPDHPLYILTSDQGMARMAMAEGIKVMFFQARAVPRIDSTTVTGALFSPFFPEVHTVSFANVLWELAVSFGRARVRVPDADAELDVWGIGAEEKGAPWQPHHAAEDLLWVEAKLPAPPPTERQSERRTELERTERPISEPQTRAALPASEPRSAPEELKGSYKFSADKMFLLIGALARETELDSQMAKETVAVKSQKTFRKYVRFLLSGGFILESENGLTATTKLENLWQALEAGNDQQVGMLLRAVPSFNELWEFVASVGHVEPGRSDLPTSRNSYPNYFLLGEAVRAWLQVPDAGIVYTPSTPYVEQFAKTAIAVYSELSSSGSVEWVLTGRWLEQLALEHGIHPLTARELLADARANEGLRVYAEGSTPDNRFDNHTFWHLATGGDTPQLEKVYLYHGGFLLPGTAAVRIKIKEADHAS